MNPILKNMLSGSKLIEGIKNILDEVISTKEERLALETKLQALVLEHEAALHKAVVEDRVSARQRETELIRAGHKNLTQNILAYGAVVAFFVLTFYIISKGLGMMEAEESFIIGNLTGMAAAIAKDIYGYYFGSSKGELEARGRRGKNGE
jgi:hypothetical protein